LVIVVDSISCQLPITQLPISVPIHQKAGIQCDRLTCCGTTARRVCYGRKVCELGLVQVAVDVRVQEVYMVVAAAVEILG